MSGLTPMQNFLDKIIKWQDLITALTKCVEKAEYELSISKKEGAENVKMHVKLSKNLTFEEAYAVHFVVLWDLLEAIHDDLLKRAVTDKKEIDRFTMLMGMIDMFYWAIQSELWGDTDFLFQVYQLHRLRYEIWKNKTIEVMEQAAGQGKMDIPTDIFDVKEPIYKKVEKHKNEDKSNRNERMKKHKAYQDYHKIIKSLLS